MLRPYSPTQEANIVSIHDLRAGWKARQLRYPGKMAETANTLAVRLGALKSPSQIVTFSGDPQKTLLRLRIGGFCCNTEKFLLARAPILWIVDEV